MKKEVYELREDELNKVAGGSLENDYCFRCCGKCSFVVSYDPLIPGSWNEAAAQMDAHRNSCDIYKNQYIK